jgi:exosortase/archaeosortase family protein
MKTQNLQFEEKTGSGKEKRTAFMRTSLVFLILAAAIPLLIFYLPVNLGPFQVLTAKITAGVINASGIEAVREGVNIRLPHANWEISIECTAIFALIVYAAFVIAYQASVQSKLYGLILGLPFIVLVNILRLLTLAWISKFAPGFVEGSHDYGWQVLFLIVVAAMWLIWIELFVCREKKADLSL